MKNILFGKLHLKNFKVHEEFEIDLSTNQTILISGRNGTGKTSILDGLYWILYDTTLKGKSGDSVIRKKSKKNCYGSIDVKVSENEYKIVKYRKDKEHGNKKFILKDGVDITPSDLKETNILIENLIISSDIFYNCLLFSTYVNNFLSNSHSYQKDIFDKILGFEKFNRYLENVKLKESSIKSEIQEIDNNYIRFTTLLETIESSLQKLKNSYKTTLYDKKEKLQSRDLEIIKLEENINNNKFQENILQALYDICNNKRQELSNTENSLRVIVDSSKSKMEKESNILQEKFRIIRDTNKSEYIKAKNINDQTISNKKSELELLKVKLSNVTNDINYKIKDKYNSLTLKYNDNNNDLIASLNNIVSNISSIDDKICNLKDIITSDMSIIAELKDSLEGGICNTCKQSIKKNNKDNVLELINNIELKCSNNNETITNYSNEIQKLESEKITINNKLQKLSSIYTTKKEEIKTEYTSLLNTECESLNTEILNITNDIEKISESFAVYDKKFQEGVTKHDIEYHNEYNLIKRQVEEEHDDEIKILQKEIQYLLEFISDAETKYNNYNILKQDLLSNKLKLDNAKENKKNTENDYTNILNDIVNEATDVTKEKDRISSDIELSSNNKKSKLRELEIINFWKTAFSDTGIKSLLLDESIPILNRKSRELCSNIDNDLKVSFDSQTKLKTGAFNNKFSINVFHTKNLSDYSELSTGELRLSSIIILLCLRHLLEVTNNIKINILFLDEILDSLDVVNSEKAVNLFSQLANEYCVLIVSHTYVDYIHSNTVYNL